MLHRLAGRLNRGNTEILRVAKAAPPDHVSAPGARGHALDVDDDLKFEFLLDVDGPLFEMNALCEAIGLFVARLHASPGSPLRGGAVGATLKRIAGEQGADTAWFATLDALRSLFIHSATPYLAADVFDNRTRAGHHEAERRGADRSDGVPANVRAASDGPRTLRRSGGGRAALG